MIQESVTLGFDPKTSKNEAVRRVFHDELARTLWLAVKQNHMTSQYFEEDCIKYAEKIRKLSWRRKSPLTSYQLLNILSHDLPGHGIIGHGESDFAAELLPFATGEKKIEFEIRTG